MISYEYLEFVFSTKLSFDVAMNGEHLTRARRGTFEIIKTLLGCSSTSLLFFFFFYFLAHRSCPLCSMALNCGELWPVIQSKRSFGSVYDDSLYVVIPEKHTICYMDYKKEIQKQKLGFTMLNACCVSTNSDMCGCTEKLVTNDGFCV